MSTAPPALSVVVMGYRNADTIDGAVRSVLGQDGAAVEVLVVTSGGDRSAQIVRERHPGFA